MALRFFLQWVIPFSGFFFVSRQVFGQKTLTVASYNIWNVMFQWDTRKQYIAKMVILRFP